MADELQYYGDPSSDSGLTIVARVYDNTGTIVGSDVSCTEVGSLAIYQGDMPTASAGTYAVRFFDGTILKGQGIIHWSGSAEITLETLNDFDPASDTVANVTLVATVTTNTDMRGTDNALLASSYTAPTTPPTAAEIYTEFTTGSNEDAFKADVSGLATQSSINALNDFDPVADTVARVTLVDTTTANTDMRGTDGANTVAPDNAGIAAIPTNPLLTTDTRLNNLDATISSRSSHDDPDLSSLATSTAVAAVQTEVDKIIKYHNNQTRFFASDGTTETTQANAYSMKVYDDDDTTVLKTISFQNASGTGVTLGNATRYV